jgi:hypothetical protein
LSLSRFRTLAHTLSFSVSIEQVPPPPPLDGVGGTGVGITGAGGGTAIGGVGTGVGLEQYDPQPCAVAARRARFTVRKKAMVVDAIAMLEAVASSSGGSYKLW